MAASLKDIVDLPIVIPSSNVQRIQEGHITVAHIICELVEDKLYGKLKFSKFSDKSQASNRKQARNINFQNSKLIFEYWSLDIKIYL